MKKIALIATLIIFFSLNSIAQTIQFKKMSKTAILDSICNYMLVPNSWSLEVCNFNDFDSEKRWERGFMYGYGNYEHKYISNETEIELSANPSKINIDTINFSIHFPYEDIGGPGKASGLYETFSLNLKNIKSISWEMKNNKLVLDIQGDRYIGSHIYENGCYEIKRLFTKISINFRTENLPKNFKDNLNKYFQLLNQ